MERVRYISREQAWKDFQAALGAHSNVVEGLPEDVLPASFEIFVKPAYRDGPIVEGFVKRLRKEGGITTVDYPQEWVDRLSLVVLALQWAKWVLGWNPFRGHLFHRPEHGAASHFSAEG